MNYTKKIALVLLAASTSLACQYHARSAEDYSKETKSLLNSKKAEIRSCYEAILKKDKKAAGTVVVNFKVAPKTGEITDAKVAKKKSTAPDAVGKCVIDAMKGLKLDPPDQREGVASFELTFKPNKAKQL